MRKQKTTITKTSLTKIFENGLMMEDGLITLEKINVPVRKFLFVDIVPKIRVVYDSRFEFSHKLNSQRKLELFFESNESHTVTTDTKTEIVTNPVDTDNIFVIVRYDY
jgi:hypothetical protein